MRRPPYDPNEGVLSRRIGVHVAWLGCLMGVVTLGVGAWAYREVMQDSLLAAVEAACVSTLVFATLALMQLGRAMAIRSFHDLVFRMKPLGDPTLLATSAVGLAPQMSPSTCLWCT